MTQKGKTALAFSALGALVILGLCLTGTATEGNPYERGFCVTGLVFLLMLYIPNILWGLRKKPEGYEEAAQRENRTLLLFERAGEAFVTVCVLVFPSINPSVRFGPEGLSVPPAMLFWVLALVLMLLYEGFWIRYFRSEGKLTDFYASYAGFPLAGAVLPVLAALLLGVYSRNLLLLLSACILGVGHIGIHYGHWKELPKEETDS